MIPLYGESEANGKRDVLEGRFIWLALEALKIGTSVVLDFGCWTRDERTALRSLATAIGASCTLVYLPVDPTTQLERVNRRLADTPGETFPMTQADLNEWRANFEVPDASELSDSEASPPPPEWPTWYDWAATRWPSLPDP
jgi:predicted kinase